MLVALMALFATVTHADVSQVKPAYPRIANCYFVQLTPWSTEQDLAEIARTDLLIGGVWANWNDETQLKLLAEKMAALREINPNIIILDFSSSAPYAYPSDTTFPAGGWLLQPDGTHIKGWPGTEMINLTKPSVIDWLVKQSVNSIKLRGFDGTFIDCMGSGFDWWACNIELGEAYQIDADGDGVADTREALDKQWIAAKTELSQRVREAIGTEYVFMTNQAGDWGMPHMNGILLEDYLDYVINGTQTWDWAIGEYLRWDAGVKNKPNVTTIVSSSAIEPPYDPWKNMTEEERQVLLDKGYNLKQRMRFGLAATLMGDGYYAYDLHTRWRGQRWWYPEYDAPIGTPQEQGKKHPDGSWRREFTGGTVVVNPTRFDLTVQFNCNHKDMSSDKVGPNFIVPAMDGRIFCSTDEAPRTGTMPDPSLVFSLQGPEEILQRDDRLMVRKDNYVAVFKSNGEMLLLSDRKQTLAQNLRPFITKDDKWKDFSYTDTRYEILPTGNIVFTGIRAQDEMKIAYTIKVRPEPDRLTVSYQWKALTVGHAHMWRQQVDFPVSEYAGGVCEISDVQLTLPVERASQPNLTGKVRQVTLTTADGATVGVETSRDAGLVDERHYGVPAYRLGAFPVSGDFAAGMKADFRIRFSFEQ